jgi:Domain of unknown function DUF1828
MMNCSELQNIIGFECTEINGRVCISTPYAMADGTGINLFVSKEHENYLRFTDAGTTIFSLVTSGQLRGSKAQRAAISRICESSEVMLSELGEISVLVKPNLASYGFSRITEALLQIGSWQQDLLDGSNDRLLEQVEELLKLWKPSLPIEKSAPLKGATGRVYKFDFKQGEEWVDAISSHPNAAAAAAHKLLDIRALSTSASLAVRLVIDDTKNPVAASYEGQILSSLATVMPLSALERVVNPKNLH